MKNRSSTHFYHGVGCLSLGVFSSGKSGSVVSMDLPLWREL
ncbi:MAG: hypothetical protein AAGF35_00635 [Pseudomonadota bacterium]